MQEARLLEFFQGPLRPEELELGRACQDAIIKCTLAEPSSSFTASGCGVPMKLSSVINADKARGHARAAQSFPKAQKPGIRRSEGRGDARGSHCAIVPLCHSVPFCAILQAFQDAWRKCKSAWSALDPPVEAELRASTASTASTASKASNLMLDHASKGRAGAGKTAPWPRSI